MQILTAQKKGGNRRKEKKRKVALRAPPHSSNVARIHVSLPAQHNQDATYVVVFNLCVKKQLLLIIRKELPFWFSITV